MTLPRQLNDHLIGIESGCWLWTGPRNSYRNGNAGYGYLRYQGRQVSSHRLAYELLVGPIPDGLFLDHLCKVTLCCNPEHLEPVTNRENLTRHFRGKTHCTKGHPWTPESSYIRKNGHRMCRLCKQEWKRTYRNRMRAKGLKPT